MTTPVLANRAATTRLLTVITTLYVLFVFYGSWVPLHFSYRPLSMAWQSFSALPFFDQRIVSATDWATNFLLLLPLSFLCAQRFLPQQRGMARFATRLLVVALGLALACTLEFSQLYFPPRTVSQKDILALSLGALVGVILQYRWGAVVESWLGMLWQRESHQARVIRLLHVYLLVLFVFSVLPLDLTLSVVEVYHKWREGRVVLMPFAALKGSAFNKVYETVTDVLIWVPVGLFWALNHKSSLLKVAGIGWVMGAVIELAQLFVYSRVTDVTDILLAGVGTAIGGWLASCVRRTRFSLADVPVSFWSVSWAIWVCTVLAVFWYPFDFQAARATAGNAWAALSRLPFLMLYHQSEFGAINEILRKLAFFLPGGMLWGLGSAARQGHMSNGTNRHTGLLAILAVAVTLECGQLLLPGKYADLTDVFLETTGGVLGLILVRWVLNGMREGTLVDAARPDYAAAEATTRAHLTRLRQRGWKTGWRIHMTTFLALTVCVFVATRLPFVPYNLRELNAAGVAGIFSSLALALLAYWWANGHFLFLRWAGQAQMLALPAWLVIYALVAWLVIRAALPLESIHDIVGAPVLAWPPELELAGRYVALHSALALQMIGATLFVQLVFGSGRLASLLVWLMFCALLAWPLHWIVVVAAATDNLTELMRGGGSFAASTLLATGFFALFVTGGAIAALFAFPQQRGKAVILATVSFFVAAAAFWYGSDQVIVKYGKVFSAWQFLLSTNRQNYVQGVDLLLRFAIAYLAVVIVLGMLQASQFRALRIRHLLSI